MTWKELCRFYRSRNIEGQLQCDNYCIIGHRISVETFHMTTRNICTYIVHPFLITYMAYMSTLESAFSLNHFTICKNSA